MNMKKILKIITGMGCIGFLCMAHAETDAFVKHANDRAREDVVFTLMRKHMWINHIALLCNGETVLPLKELPLKDLYDKLRKKSGLLVAAEKASVKGLQEAITAKSVKDDFMTTSDMHSVYDIFDTESVKKVFENLPASAEAIILDFAHLHDQKAFIDELLGKNFSLIETSKLFMDLEMDLELVKQSKLSEADLKVLITLFYENEIKQLNGFIEQNRDILDKVSKIADNEFKITMQQCRTIKSEQYCTSNAAREIGSLSEIIPYINTLPSEALQNDL